MKNNTKGFTLIELLVVVLIIGILAAIALPQYFKAVERSRAAEALSMFTAIAGAQQRYALVHGSYANNFQDLDIEFRNQDGSETTSDTLETQSFNIQIQSGPASNSNLGVVATRKSSRYGEYRLERNYQTGRITCHNVGGKDPICNSIGLTVTVGSSL